MALQADPEKVSDSAMASDDEDPQLRHGVHRRIRAKSMIMNLEKILGTSALGTTRSRNPLSREPS
jgi:hypothetical protein